MKERSLVFFTLLSQAAVGTFLATLLLQIAHAFRPETSPENAFAIFHLSTYLLMVSFALIGLSLLTSFAHLGAPWRAARAIRNLNRSWLSREITFSLLFWGFTGLAVLSFLFPSVLRTSMLTSLAGGTVCGLALIYSMARVYMQRTVPGWNTPRTLLSFFFTAASLGLLITALCLSFASQNNDAWVPATTLQFARGAALALALQVFLQGSFKQPPAPENPLHPGQRQAEARREPRTGWGLLCTLLAGILALLPGLVIEASWLFLLASLCLAFAGELAARHQFYLSYWRLGI